MGFIYFVEFCIMVKSKFIRFLTCFVVMVGSLSYFSANAKADFSQQTKMPEGSYQLARSVFLPKADDDVWLSHYKKLPYDYNQHPCGKMGYSIKKPCPEHGNCSPCPTDSNYLKLNSCNNTSTQKYRISSSGLKCEPYCDTKTCSLSEYPMTTCPEGMDCYDKCQEVADSCATTYKFKLTNKCLSGYCYIGGRCQKPTVTECGSSSGAVPIWKDKCPTGYLCTKLSKTYMTADCQTGSCYQCQGCDESKGYYRPSTASTGSCSCAYMPCFNQVNTCSGYAYDKCPDHGVCNDSCTVKNKDCSEGATKFNLTGCESGYTLENGTCVKKCTSKKGDITNKLDYVHYSYDTNEQCLKADPYATACHQAQKYTDTECNTQPIYGVSACKEGYFVDYAPPYLCYPYCTIGFTGKLEADEKCYVYKSEDECLSQSGTNRYSCHEATKYTTKDCREEKLWAIKSCQPDYIYKDCKCIKRNCTPNIDNANSEGFKYTTKPGDDVLYETKTYINNSCENEVRYKINGCKDSKKYLYTRFGYQCMQIFDYVYADYSVSTELDCSKHPIAIVLYDQTAVSFLRTDNEPVRNFENVAKEFYPQFVGDYSAQKAYEKTKGNWSSGSMVECRAMYMYQDKLNEKVNQIISKCGYQTTYIPKFTGSRYCGFSNIVDSQGKNQSYTIEFNYNKDKLPSYNDFHEWTTAEYEGICGVEDVRVSSGSGNTTNFGNNCLKWQQNNNAYGTFFPVINFATAKVN